MCSTTSVLSMTLVPKRMMCASEGRVLGKLIRLSRSDSANVDVSLAALYLNLDGIEEIRKIPAARKLILRGSGCEFADRSD
jgi:hypothetical protein